MEESVMGADRLTQREIPTVMKAMVRERYGTAAEVLEERTVPVPQPGPGTVLVEVHSSSVNAMEWHLMNGKPYLLRPVFGLRPKSPILGADVSGIVVAVGDGVDRFAPGDEVFGEVGAGAYAEYVVVPESHLAIKPAGVSFEESAVVGVAGLTALQGLRDVIGLGRGQSILINGASGGVGTYAVQVAKALGAEVTAVCSTRNMSQALDLGADHVLDYTTEDVTRSGRRFDAIFDIAGNHEIRAIKGLLAPNGIYVMVGGSKNAWLGPIPRLVWSKVAFALGNRRTANFIASSRQEDLQTLGEMLAGGEIRSVIEASFPLAEVRIPLDEQGRFHARGKTLIEVKGRA